jgi:hypothetical protein
LPVLKAAILVVSILLFALPSFAVDYAPYHTVAEAEAALREWSAKHSSLTKLHTIGKSAGGKNLLVLEIAGNGSVPAAKRQAVFVGANIAGFHNAGTEAALDLIRTLLTSEQAKELLASRTFYIAPVLNPDAHDTMFAKVRYRREGNGQQVDYDRDGLFGEDGVDDLDGNGVITRMRIPDANGGWLPHPDEPRVMVRADGLKQWTGTHRIESEGDDSDGDGRYNEDGVEGIIIDQNFAHQFPYPAATAGPWPSYAPEAKALMDFLLARRQVGLAIVYGPANNLLDIPRSLGGGGDLGTTRFKIPASAAGMLGFDPEEEYTLDEVWEVAQNLPFVQQNNVTKEQMAQFLGAGAATKLEDDDQKLLEHLAKEYKEALKKAELADDRPGEQYRRGGFTPWLYYQFGALALELDVWGVPPVKKAATGDAKDEPLTLDRLEAMSSEDFLALGEEKLGAFLKEIKAPPQFTAAMAIERVKAGQVTPKQMAQMAKQMGAGAPGGGAAKPGEDDGPTKRARDILAWVDQHAPEASHPWKSVTLSDGTRAEVGGLDPFIAIAPPMAMLQPAIAVHTSTVLDLAKKMAQVAIHDVQVTDLGGGVYRVRAVAGNRGFFPSHTKMAARAQANLPARLTLEPGSGMKLVTGRRTIAENRLAGASGTMAGEWLVRAERGASFTVRIDTESAGSDQKTMPVGKGQ